MTVEAIEQVAAVSPAEELERIRREATEEFVVHWLSIETMPERDGGSSIDTIEQVVEVHWLSIETMPERDGGSSIDTIEQVVEFAKGLRDFDLRTYRRLYW